MLGMLKEVLILFVMFAALRLTVAGIHLRSNLGCTIVSLIAFIGSVYLTEKYPLSILPCTYKLLKSSYNNFEKYEMI
ncbi:accessory gene regulator B family protein [Clostridium estertheticum]|uniref:accessory gene regulator B family protein n=2 Tax=Clostridium estertheticum TaxID=238834 RepID=UPI001CF5F01B|nr:accessory gene regulator B family protein [Clostridium estertheticum]MCB2309315.1 accessory gene regulator B family protein [Clostridium estertheticum]MCB2347729.1 accessory gene regulator B family protein [Clostridium estertheticum]MCB2352284.1 accessory gene regulator B family protein [Clostridium estertheticum]WAG48378.1 accessory gene regulator B family protein [Clostridium estertheticum]